MEYRHKTFRQVVPGDYKILYRVHPMHQQDVLNILSSLSIFNNIRVILFGSVITDFCDINSDIDIAIEVLNQPLTLELRASIDSAILSALGITCDYDLIWYNNITSVDLKEEIDTNGFVIREI